MVSHSNENNVWHRNISRTLLIMTSMPHAFLEKLKGTQLHYFIFGSPTKNNKS